MGDPNEQEEREFASPPCSLSELDPEFAGLAPRKAEKPRRLAEKGKRPKRS